jgi:pimeloyl-ACP methyl ester carboxylesterase
LKFLIPKPLAATCKPSYPFRLTSIQSDWDDIDAVVDFIRAYRHVGTVNLIAWSRGAPRAGGYVARHPDKVNKLVLYAPVYKRTTLSDPPPAGALPEPGVPIHIFDAWTFPDWDGMVQCPNQFDPQIRGVISPTQLQFDQLGSTWGTRGVIRSPVQNTNPATTPPPGGLWGWNPESAGQVNAPTLIIRGALDTLAPSADVQNLFDDLGTASKVSITVSCSSHFLVWENQHLVLLKASRDWLHLGTVNGHAQGTYAVS